MHSLRTKIPSLVSALLVALSISAISPAAHAAVVKPIDIVKVHFNPAGPDRHNNPGFNREYIQIRNTGTKTVDLTGYYILDHGSKHKFVFPKGAKIAKGKSIVIRSGKGKNTANTLYWQNKGYVWNNTGDVANLYNAKKQRVESCNFLKKLPRSGTKTC